MTDNRPPTITLKGIKKTFGSFQALKQVDATILPGRISAFVGPNGAGKTTLFHILTGNLKPDAGTVKINNKNITGMEPWRIAELGVGKLFQDVRIFENMTVLENVVVALMKRKEENPLYAFTSLFKNKEIYNRYNDEAMHCLEYVGLESRSTTLGGELSFGQQKLLSIARLIAHKSSCLLLDEPTAALSPTMTKEMIKLIQRLISEKDISIALIEHNMTVVRELAFYTYFMHEGEIFCHGTQNCVLENPDVRELYMGLSGVTNEK
ncbi:MAG: ATP-binding cassette domain-containing protein [Kiritimatiellae bacterium]|jgi:ABC-type branched-subunit amino acid transport system ATPase component|nr:ATP-binding cassette domain-containing protein [Kiritimatiellia bacterium]